MNEIILTGAGIPKGTGGTLNAEKAQPVQLTAIIRNYRSAQFYAGQPTAPDPTSVDFIGSVETVYDANVGWCSQQVVDNIAKREMRMAGQGYYVKTFQAAALFMWGANDARQVRPRLVKFGDVVDYVDRNYVSSKWIVARARLSIHQHYGGTAFARMVYQLNSPLPDREWIIDRSDQS